MEMKIIFFLVMENSCFFGSFRNELLFNVLSIIILKEVKKFVNIGIYYKGFI